MRRPNGQTKLPTADSPLFGPCGRLDYELEFGGLGGAWKRSWTRMRVDDNLVNLIPGMAVTAEIKTGTRRIISYLFSPLLRYGHDSLRER